MYAWLRRHPMLVDGVLAAALVFGGLASTFAKGMFLGVPLSFGLAVPVVFRRKYPVAAYYTAIAAGGLQVAAGPPALRHRCGHPDPAVHAGRLHAAAHIDLAGLAVCLSGSAVGVLRWLSLTDHSLLRLAHGRPRSLFAGPVAGRLGARRLDALPARRTTRRWRTGPPGWKRERDAQAQIAAAAERARIARELHDVIAHNVSVMVVQADGASYALDSSPARARQALARHLRHRAAGPGRDAPPARRAAPRRRCRQPGRGARCPASASWASCSTRPGRAGCRCRSPSRASPRRCPAASRWPPTGSCRSP